MSDEINELIIYLLNIKYAKREMKKYIISVGPLFCFAMLFQIIIIKTLLEILICEKRILSKTI